VLVNNAGGAEGLEPIAEMDEGRWRWMYEVNVLGLAMMTNSLLPQVRRSGNGHVVNIGSAAGTETYVKGAGCAAAKFGVHADFGSLRLELLGEDVRVTEVMPGAVRTEFDSCASGATRRRRRRRTGASPVQEHHPYRGITSLTPEDVAECVRWVVGLPPHVNVDRLDVRPVRQGAVTLFARDE
jgi:NADP-dependent 3-hydroxy acid dehydrogenase YdfG